MEELFATCESATTGALEQYALLNYASQDESQRVAWAETIQQPQMTLPTLFFEPYFGRMPNQVEYHEYQPPLLKDAIQDERQRVAETLLHFHKAHLTKNYATHQEGALNHKDGRDSNFQLEHDALLTPVAGAPVQDSIYFPQRQRPQVRNPSMQAHFTP